MGSILALQPRMATSAGGRSSDELVRDVSQEMLAALPAKPLASEQASVLQDPFAPLPCGAPNSLAVVLRQEVGAAAGCPALDGPVAGALSPRTSG